MPENNKPREIMPRVKVQMMRQQLETARFLLCDMLEELDEINKGTAANLLGMVCKIGETEEDDPRLNEYLTDSENIVAGITATGNDVCALRGKLARHNGVMQMWCERRKNAPRKSAARLGYGEWLAAGHAQLAAKACSAYGETPGDGEQA